VRRSDIKASYLISFDSNAASHIRGLFEGKDGDGIRDLRELLIHFDENRMNWQIVPYLLEASVRSEEPLTSKRVFETVLAATKLEDIDSKYFLETGKLRQRSEDESLYKKARFELERFEKNLSRSEQLRHLYVSIYVCILKCADLELRNPGKRNRFEKMFSLVDFMHHKLHCMMTTILNLAWLWFSAEPEAVFFGRLNAPKRDLIEAGRNIAWDVFHLTRLPQECIQPDGADFLVPYFLTFDRKLARVMKSCGLRLCLIHRHSNMPFTVYEAGFAPVLELLSEADSSCTKYFCHSAHLYRAQKVTSGWRADLELLKKESEATLASFQTKA
jgi:hypothetical protein